MEQHKVLIIIVSVSLFVAAVIGIGLVFFYPRPAESASAGTAGAAAGKSGFDPIEYVRQTDKPQTELKQPSSEDKSDVIIVYGEKPQKPEEKAPTGDQGKKPAEVVELVRESDNGGTTTTTQRAPATPAKPSPATAERQSAPPAPTPAARQEPASVRRPPQPSTKRVRVTEYWIQVIASPVKDTVLQAQQQLEEQNLAGRISLKSVGGKDYYRLRVGPYQDKGEAEKFLEWIRGMKSFDSSYISEEYPLKSAAN